MKNRFIFSLWSIVACLILANFSFAQSQSVPSVDLKTLDGKVFNTSSISNDGKPIIISFWATWCVPCNQPLNQISEKYPNWLTETGVKIIAISIDDVRNSHKVKPYVDGRAWEFEVYLDENADFKRAMNVNNVPHTFVLNGKREIVWQYNLNEADSADKIYEVVK